MKDFLAKVWTAAFGTLYWLGFDILAKRMGHNPEMSNCAFYAFNKFWNEGGAVIIVKSRYGWWPHFLWESPDGERWEYSPPKRRYHRVAPPLIFHGKEQRYAGRTSTTGTSEKN